jgi:hypothetical protein
MGSAATTAFTLCWAFAGLFDKGYYGHWTWSPANFAFAASCAWVIASPRSAQALLTMAFAQILDWFSDQSIMGNHPLIMVAANATLLLSAVLQGFRRTWKADAASQVLGGAAPAIRLQVLVIYSWATFHKLNTDFLSTEHGCVRFLAIDPINRPLPLALFSPTKPWIEAGIHGTLLVEGLIPLLLAFGRSRGWGILLAIAFHSFLSSGPRNGFSAFAVVIFPLLWLFASEESMERLVGLGRLCLPRRIEPSLGTGLRLALLAAIAAASLADHALQINRTFPAWISFDLLVLAWLIAETRRGIAAIGNARPNTLRPANCVLLVMPLLTLLNGACPYLGLKTETSFAMYSNLRTEGGRSNHLLIPPGLAPFPFQDELVKIVDSSDPGLRAIARSGMSVTWFDLRRRAWMNPSMSVSYSRHGQVTHLETVRDHQDLIPEVPGWLGRLMPFRPVEADGPRGSDH